MPRNSRSGRLCASSSAPIDRREVCPVHASAAQAAPHLASRVPSTNSPTTSVGEGSFVAYNGNVFIIAGGAPLYVGTWSIYGGEKPVTQLSDGEFANLRPFPSDGTFISTQTGAVYRFAGGAPLYVPTWDDVGGSQPTILVNQDDLTRAGEAAPFDHIRRYPADGTFVNTPTRAVYRFAGGAPLYVPSWDDVGGSQPSTRVSQAPLDAAGDPSYPWGHVAKYPQDGTFVNTPTGTVYRFAGGAPLAVSSWEAVGGSHASTQVSAEVLERGGATPYPWGHTRFFPADGTVLSPLYVAWSFKVTGGVARKVTRQAGIAVDIAALDNAGRPIPWNHLKTSVPRATLNPLPTTTTQPTISLTWGALVTASRTVSYDVRWKTSTGVWKYPAAMQGLAASPVGGPLPRVGTRYCFSIRAHNAAGLTGPVSVASCTTRT